MHGCGSVKPFKQLKASLSTTDKISRGRAMAARLVHNQEEAGSSPVPAIMKIGELKDFLELLDDDEELQFEVIHPSDKKYLSRSTVNGVAVILSHKSIKLKAEFLGFQAAINNYSDKKPVVFLTVTGFRG